MPNKENFSTHDEYLLWYRNYRLNNPKVREYTRNYNNQWRRKNGYGSEKRSADKFPQKVKARQLVNREIIKGKIVRGKCEICDSSRSQAHHDNYLKPLEIRWFCALHHKQFEKNSLSTVFMLQN